MNTAALYLVCWMLVGRPLGRSEGGDGRSALIEMKVDKIFVGEGIWRNLTLYLAEGTLHDIYERS